MPIRLSDIPDAPASKAVRLSDIPDTPTNKSKLEKIGSAASGLASSVLDLSPMTHIAKFAGKIYNPLREAVAEVGSEMTPLSLMPGYAKKVNPVTQINPVLNLLPEGVKNMIPGPQVSLKDVVREGSGFAMDAAAGEGALKFAGKAIGAARAVPKFTGRAAQGVRNIGRSIEQLRNPAVPFEQRVAGVKSQISEKFTGRLESAAQKAMKQARAELGLTDAEIAQLKTEHGGSTASLVDRMKTGLKGKIQSADTLFEKTIEGAPDELAIKTDNFSRALQSLIKELKAGAGKPPSVTRDLEAILADLQAAGKTSPILDASGNAITIKEPGMRTFNKKQFLATRRNLGNMLTGNGEVDRYIMTAKNSLDNSAIESGVKGLKEAKGVYQKAMEMEGRFLNRNTGDLKVANEANLKRIGTKNGLNKQAMDHIAELEKYLNDPVSTTASKINKIREFEAVYSAEKPLPVPLKEKLAAEKESLRRAQIVNERSNLRDRLLRKKQGREKIAKLGFGATALVGVPEVARRVVHLGRGKID